MSGVLINRARFLRLCYEASTREHARFNIGTLKEKTLHRVLKNYFCGDTAKQEVPVAGYVADIAEEDRIVEIQTSGFAPMRDKLEAFLPLYPVTIVYPIAQVKWISNIDPVSGDISPKKKSPKKGRLTDVIPELVYIRKYLTHPRLTIRVVMLETEEYRMPDTEHRCRRSGAKVRYERMPVDLFDVYDFRTAEDYRALLPFQSGEVFTGAALAKALAVRGGSMRKSALVRVLTDVGAIERVGKEGNAWLYCIPAAEK